MNLQERLIQIIAQRRAFLKNAQLTQNITPAKAVPSPEVIKFEHMKRLLVETVKLIRTKFQKAGTGDEIFMNFDNKDPFYFQVLLFPQGKPFQTRTVYGEVPGITVKFIKQANRIQIKHQNWFGLFESKEEIHQIKDLSEDFFITELIKNIEEVFEGDIIEREKKLEELKARL